MTWLSDWMKQTNGRLKYLESGIESEGVKIIKESTGQRLDIDPRPEQGVSMLQEEQDGASSYDGHFAVSRDGDNNVDVAAGNAIIGQDNESYSKPNQSISTTNGVHYLCLTIYWSGSAYVGLWEDLTTTPNQNDVTVASVDYPCFRKEIAQITVAETVISSIKQTQYGEIVVGSRLV